MLAFGRIINLEDHIVMEKLQESSAWKDEAKNLSKGLLYLKKMCFLYPLAKGKIDEVAMMMMVLAQRIPFPRSFLGNNWEDRGIL